MATYILVLGTETGYVNWPARNQNSDINVLRSHPYYNPGVSHPVTKRVGDVNCGNVMAIDVTGNSSPVPAIIIEIDPGFSRVAMIERTMNGKFAEHIGKRSKSWLAAVKKGTPVKNKTEPVQKKIAKKVAKKVAKKSK